MSEQHRKTVLTGDRPTGPLHLGHYVGSLQNRLELQKTHQLYLIVADLHTLTTKSSKEEILALREHVRDLVLDQLALGIDPKKSLFYLQSACPAVSELHLLFSMLATTNRLFALPSIKEMARNAQIAQEAMSLGLLGYPVLQSADILMAGAHCVPVGKDNLAHIEMSRDLARKFNQTYGAEVFTEPEALLSATPTLIGTDGKGKMSKSAGNCIFLKDEAQTVEKKVKSMFTDPERIHAHLPGRVEGNPVFIYHDLFNPNGQEVLDLKERYQKGKVGDVEVKERLSFAINGFLEPIRARREQLAKEKHLVEQLLFEGTQKMRALSEKTLDAAKSAMGLKGLWSKIVRGAGGRGASL